jgi:uncharacterized protein YndB with AHSA1/START domain
MRKRITLERTYKTSLSELWDLWTTKDGIEAWWGPEGFRVEVDKLDLRVGGELVYWMIAATPEMEKFMAGAGMPSRHIARIRYTEVTPNERLAYLHAADFIPNVPTYDVATVVEFRALTDEIQLHDDLWTQRQQQGWESELGKLGKVVNR